MLSMDFPSRPGTAMRNADTIVAALGVRPREVLASRDLLVLVESESDVREFQPDFDAIAKLDTFGVILSAPGGSVDYVYRFFAPRQGIPEDPATGSANCTLVPYWAARLRKTELSARQLSPRGAELRCALHGDRVLIAGSTVEYLKGEITVDT
jgi:predicted PhzF superfamily epimerase YddE/YHI9